MVDRSPGRWPRTSATTARPWTSPPGLSYPAKAERARRDARVALLFADPVGSGLSDPPIVLVQGLASVRDADLQANLDRYVEASMVKTPQVYATTPRFLLRRMSWYLARIWVQVTPLQMVWWPRGRLDGSPQRWHAPAGTVAPPSDPAPTGKALPSRTGPPTDWRPFGERAARLGPPVLTVTAADGWPLPVRARSVQRVEEGYLLDLPAGVAPSPGPACLTFDTHTATMDGQENVVLVGRVAGPDRDGRVRVQVERALTDWSITGNRLTRTLSFLSNGRALRPRLVAEAARRGQPVPIVRLDAGRRRASHPPTGSRRGAR